MRNSLMPKAWANDMPRSLFRGLFDLDRDLDTLFESGGTWWPAVEARTKDGDLVLRCDLPGVDPSDIEVSLEGTTLTVTALRPPGMVRGVPSTETAMADASTPVRTQRRTRTAPLVRASTAGNKVQPASERLETSASE